MSLNVISNYAANVAQRHLQKADEEATRSLAKLSAGTRVLSARDDAASAALGARIRSDITGLKQASVNIGQAASMLQIGDGAMGSINDILVRTKTLATQASSAQLAAPERAMLQSEFLELQGQIDRIANGTRFNGIDLLRGASEIVAGAMTLLSQSTSVGQNTAQSLALAGSGNVTASGGSAGTAVTVAATVAATEGTVIGAGNTTNYPGASAPTRTGTDGTVPGTALTASTSVPASTNQAQIATFANASFSTTANNFLTATINGTKVQVTQSGTINTDLGALRDAINSNAAISAAVGATLDGQNGLVLTAKAANTAFTSDIRKDALKDLVTFAAVGDPTDSTKLSFTYNGRTVSVTDGAGANTGDATLAALVTAINADTVLKDVILASAPGVGGNDNDLLKITAVTAGTALFSTGHSAALVKDTNLQKDTMTFSAGSVAAGQQMTYQYRSPNVRGAVSTDASVTIPASVTGNTAAATGLTAQQSLIVFSNQAPQAGYVYQAKVDGYTGNNTTFDKSYTFQATAASGESIGTVLGRLKDEINNNTDFDATLGQKEVQRITFATTAAANGTITIGGVATTVANNDTVAQVAQKVVNNKAAILAGNSTIDDVLLENDGTGTKVLFVFKASAGNATSLTATVSAGVNTTGTQADVVAYDANAIQITRARNDTAFKVQDVSVTAGVPVEKTITVNFNTDQTTTLTNLAAAINSDSTLSGRVTASSTSTTLVAESKTAGEGRFNSVGLANVIEGVKQVSRYNLTADDASDRFTVAIGADSVSVDAASTTTTAVVDQMVAAINANTNLAAKVLASRDGSQLLLTAKTGGTGGAFTATVTASNAAGSNQRDTVSFSGTIVRGNVYKLTVDDQSVDYRASGYESGFAEVAEGLRSRFASSTNSRYAGITAAVSGSTLTLTASTASHRFVSAVKTESAEGRSAGDALQLSFRVGSTAGANDAITVKIDSVTSTALGVSSGGSQNVNISTTTAAASAITAVDTAIDRIADRRAKVGAQQNALEYASQNLATTIENSEAARSNLMDLDVAAEMSYFTSRQILQQAGVSMLAQANQMPQNLLRLFR